MHDARIKENKKKKKRKKKKQNLKI